MPEPVPYTHVLDGQFRRARQRIEAGEEVPVTLLVIGSTQTRIEVVPFMAADADRERWYFRRGEALFSMGINPRAALLVRDGPSSEPTLFGQSRAVMISYRDGDGLARAQALPYNTHGEAVEWLPAQTITHDASGPLLEQLWNGYRLAQRAQTDQRSRHRTPAWRFRR